MNSIIASLIAGLLKALSPEVVKKAVDALLDKIEDSVAGSKTKIDDTIVLPLCKTIREALNVPDND